MIASIGEAGVYAFGLSVQPAPATPTSAASTVRSLTVRTTLTPAELADRLANQGVCNRAADAMKRASPAYGSLAYQCAQARAANVAAHQYYVDAMTPDDAAYRVALTNAGEAVVAASPQLAAMRSALPNESQRRGFTIAQGVRAGSLDPAYPGWLAMGLMRDPELLRGFTDAMQAPAAGAGGGALTQALQPEEGPLDSIPKPVLIAGAVAVAAAIGLVIYKVTKK